jgi:glutathione S-transferase
MSIADISVACELQQLEAVPGAIELLFEGTGAVLPWMDRVKDELAPHWDEVGALLVKVRAAAEKQGLRA